MRKGCLHKQLKSPRPPSNSRNVELDWRLFLMNHKKYGTMELERIKHMDTQMTTRWDFIGLSTDSKPTPTTSPKVVDGSTFFEADTSRLYFWTKTQWYRKTSDVQTNIERHMKW